MILSNQAILEAIQAGKIIIDPFPWVDPSKDPFNTSSIDLSLGEEIRVPKKTSAVIDLSHGSIAEFWSNNSEKIINNDPEQPYQLKPNKFVLATTKEVVGFPIPEKAGETCYAARIEGRSSCARCGILVHFTAPTIHAGFQGNITLEIINLGPMSFNLVPGNSICQLIIEEVRGSVSVTDNQFMGQSDSIGAEKQNLPVKKHRKEASAKQPSKK